ncbi:beta strand repeat-containing protein, partial [Marinobacterium jannaschii]|uniref:beta strand repeat-containing protein n=1 Tax=Marinobacterium jannaschii TaxID=64970 RepID=UPI00048782CB
SGGSWSVTLSSSEVQGLTEGSVSITADVADQAGNNATQATKSISYDKTAPTLSINTVATDDRINASEDDSSLTVGGSTNAEDGQTISVDVGGVSKTGTASSGSWSVTLSSSEVQGLSQGSISITADVADQAGNNATQATATVNYDSALPTLETVVRETLANPENSESFQVAITFADVGSGIDATTIAVGNITVSGPGSVGNLTVSSVSYDAGSKTATYTIAAPSGGWNENQHAGSYTVALNTNQVADLAGNSVAANATAKTFTVSFNTAPEISSGGGGATATVNLAENVALVTTVQATDIDSDTLSYSITGGTDQADFSIDSNTGALTFDSAPAYVDGGDNEYQVEVTVSDGRGGSDLQTLTVNVLSDIDGDQTPDVEDEDIDGDGLLNTAEQGVTNKSGTGTGDGNGDGIDDYKQVNVASLVATGSGSEDSRWVTFAVADGLKITGAEASEKPSRLPRSVKMPLGQFALNIENVTPGATVEVEVFADASKDLNKFYKKNPDTGRWVDITGSRDELGAKTKLTFSLTDGGTYDKDGVVNGVIVDPGMLVNEVPLINSDGGETTASINHNENSTAVTTVAADAVGTVSYSITGGADQAKFSIDTSTGALSFKNAPDFEGPASAGSDNSYAVEITATDEYGSDTQALTINVVNVNEAPQAVADSATAVEAGGVANGTVGSNASGNVFSNDTDVDAGDTKTVSAVSFGTTAGTVGQSLTASYGALTLNSDGSYSYVIDDSNAAVQALRNSTQTLTESFSYTLIDAAGLTDQTTLTITIEGRNDNPVAVADTGTAVEASGIANGTAGSTASGNVLDNDSNVDGTGETKTVTAVVFGSTNGTVGQSLTASYGSLALNSDGFYSYAVNETNAAVQALRNGDTLTEVFTYTVTDTDGLTAETTLTITIEGRNDAPAFASSESGSGGSGNSGNESTDGSASTFEITEGPSDTPLSLSEGQTVTVGFYVPSTVNSDTWENAQDFYDSEPGMSTAVYDYANSLDSYDLDVDLLFVMQPDNALADAEIAALSAFLDKGGRIFFVGEHNGYKPIQNGHISDAITALGGSITVLGGSYFDTSSDNDGDTLNLNNSSLMSGVSKFVTAAYAQLEIDATISKAVIVDDSNRIVMADQALSNGRVTVLADQNWLNSSRAVDGNWTFLRNMAIDTVQSIELVADGGNPNADFVTESGLTETDAGLTDSGSITLTDVDTQDEVTVTHTVVAVQKNSAGETITSHASVPGNAQLQAMLSLTPDPAIDSSNTSTSLNWGFDSGSEAFNFLREGEQLVLTYTLTADDGNGGTATQDLEIVINGSNDAPVASDTSGSAVEAGGIANATVGSSATGNVLTNTTDIDGDAVDRTVAAVEFGSSNGTVGQSLAGQYGSLTLNSDGSYSYVIDESNAAVQALRNSDQTLTETFSYQVSDKEGATDSASLTITLEGRNDNPVAVADTATA